MIGLLLCSCGGDRFIFSGSDFATDPTPPGPMGGLIAITDNGDDTVAIVDPASGALRWKIPVGFIPVELEGPHHIAADPAGEFIYINLSEAVTGSGTGPHGAHGTGTQPGFTLKLSTVDGSLVGQTRVDPNPGDLTLSADGGTIYVTHYDLLKWQAGVAAGDLRKGDASLVIIDAATMSIQNRLPLCPAAHGVRLTPDGATLYSTCGPDEIAVVDLENLAAGARRVVLPDSREGANCDHCPYALGIAPDGTVWVSGLGPQGGGSGGGGIDVYDPALGDFDPARRVRLCGRALFTAFVGAAPNFRAYTPEQACGDALDVFDGGVVTGRIDLAASGCLNVHMLALSGDDRTAWAVCEGDHVGPGSLVTVDLGAGAPTGSTPLGVFPDGLVVVP